MENDLNRKEFSRKITELYLLIFFGSLFVLLFAFIILCAYNSIKEQNTNATNISEEAVHSGGISVECPYCGKRAKLVLEIDEK